MDPYSTQMLMLNQLGHLSSTFIDHIRSILFALSLLVLGLIVAEIAKYISTAILRGLRWDRLSDWMGLTRILGKVRADVSPSSLTGEVLFWVILLSFFMKSLILTEINTLSWIGRSYFDNCGSVWQAILLMLVTWMISQWLGRLVLLIVENVAAFLAAGITRILILSVGTYAALLTLGLDRNLVLPLIMILFAGALLALVLPGAWKQGQGYRRIVRINESKEGA